MKITPNNVWEIYASLFAKITPNMSKELLSYTGYRSFGKVVDFGCGVGKLTNYLSENVKSYSGIDSNSEMIKYAKKNVKLNIKNKFVLGDIEEDNFNFNADTIVNLNVLYTLNNPEKFILKSFNYLDENGSFILSSLTPRINMKELEKVVDLEFENNLEYKLFKECNFYLTSQKYNPKLYEISQIELILKKIGFKINEVENKHYEFSNFTIVANK